MKFQRISLILLFSLFLTITANAQFKAHYINVGQAESILLELKSAAILIDAGAEDTGDTRDRDHLISYLNRFFTGRPDLNQTIYSLIISHPHIDHTRSIMDVMRSFRVLNLIDGGGNRGSGIRPLRQARRFARSRNIVYNKIEDVEIGEDGYTTSLLGALRNAPSNADIRFLAGYRGGECEDENNDSLVLRVKYGEKIFLFTGDSESEDDGCFPQISNLLDWYGPTLLDVDVYKVGHHASRNGTTEAFLRVMTPEISVISAGHKDTRSPGDFHAFQFGHPRELIVGWLEEQTSGTRPPITAYTMNGVRDIRNNRSVEKAIYCTCWDGDIVVPTNEQGTQLLQPQVSGR